MATLDELIVRIKADASQLERELKKASAATKKETDLMGRAVSELKSQFMGLVPALSAAAVTAFAKSSIDAAGRITDLAASIGIAGSTLSALEEPLLASGASLDQFAASVNLMNANIGAAVQDMNGPAAKAFDRLGLAMEDLKKLSPEEQFKAIVKALAGVKTQFEQTELGRAIFGRGFAALIPVIKETNGELGNLNATLSDSALNRVDALGDSMGRVALRIRNEFISAINATIGALENMFGVGEDATAAEMRRQIAEKEKVLARLPASNATGGGAGQVATNRARLESEVQKMRTLLEVQEAVEAKRKEREEEAKKLASESNKTGTNTKTGNARATKELSAEEKRLNELQQEGLKLTEDRRDAYEKYIYGYKKAQELLSLGYIDQLTYERELAHLNKEFGEDTKKAMKDAGDSAIVNAKIIKDSFADALESAMFDFKSFGDGAGKILEGIARNIARKNIIDPLSSGLSGYIGSGLSGGGLGQLLDNAGSYLGLNSAYGPMQQFADGGRPPVGRPSIVGEEGPEIFVPNTAGTILPNGVGLGGTNVTIVQNNTFGSGVTRQEVANMLPSVAAAAKQAVFASIERGGREASLVGRKN
jgi:hypothetical protein